MNNSRSYNAVLYVFKRLKGLFLSILDFLLPPVCIICHAEIQQSGHVCFRCFSRLELITDPCCRQCGQPFLSVEEGGKSQLCHECSQRNPPWNLGTAAFIYNEAVKNLILSLKYADRQNAIAFLTDAMCRRGNALLKEADYILPVPLHKKRLRKRKYNQSALLAWRIGKKVGKPVVPMALKKMNHTVPLGHFNKRERQNILKDAFVINQKDRALLQGKTVILIDDVMTTGTTLSACTNVLRKAGVMRIHILVIARVIRDQVDIRQDADFMDDESFKTY